MRHVIEEVYARVRLQEGAGVIEQIVVECYMQPGISTKELARRTLLPIPVAAAVKKELIRAGVLQQDRGVRCTKEGISWIEQEMGYGGMNKTLYNDIMTGDGLANQVTGDILSMLENIFLQRPQVNVQIDQSKCTPETSLRRAILCFRSHALVGKKILCVGDDDLVSVALGLLHLRLFPYANRSKTEIVVVDIDERFLQCIRQIAGREGLPIRCHVLDLRQPLPEELRGQFDCFFTDPPYTLQGLTLFLSRGIASLKRRKGLPIFLSYAHKSPDSMLAIQREFVRMGLMVSATFPSFNEYEGAEMIANKSQMTILRTTERTLPEIDGCFEDALYTGEVRRTLRTYQCKSCGATVLVGAQAEIPTIEELKNQGCSFCLGTTFQMIEKRIVP